MPFLTAVACCAVLIGACSSDGNKAVSTTPQTPTSTQVVTARCPLSDLQASGNLGDGKYTSPEIVDGVVALTLIDGRAPCVVSANATYRLEDAAGRPVDASIVITPPTDYDLVLQGRYSDRTTFARFTWKNWCDGPRRGPLIITIQLPQQPTGIRIPIDKSADPDGSIIVPPCLDSSARSQVIFPSGYWGQPVSVGLSPCHANDLELEADGYASLSAKDLNREVPGIEGSVRFNRHTSPGCTLSAWDRLELRDSRGVLLDVEMKTPIDVSRLDRGPRVIYGPSNGYEKFVWTNWCDGSRPGPLHLVWSLAADGGSLDWPVPNSADDNGSIVTPPCAAPAASGGPVSGAPARSEFSVPRTF